MQLYKKYIEVITLIGKKGEVQPIYIKWDDSQLYKIDKIYEIRPSSSVVGGSGILFRCKIQNHKRNLFFEVNRWFIESYEP